MVSLACPKCRSVDIVKSGHHHGRQRHRCKNCNFQFTRTTPRGRPAREKSLAVTLYTMGLSLNAIARLFKVSAPAVSKWVQPFVVKASSETESREAVVMELDEMWTYLRAKKTSCGEGKLILALPVSSLTGNIGIVIR